MIFTSDEGFFNRISIEETKRYFNESYEFICNYKRSSVSGDSSKLFTEAGQGASSRNKNLGEKNIISAVVHLDEGTPHMHLVFCPINKDGKLSAKSILGNQKSLSEWQTRYYNYMHERWNELERGKSAQETKRKHIPTWLFKLADNLDNLYNQLLKKIENINMIGMKKNKEEAIDLLS